MPDFDLSALSAMDWAYNGLVLIVALVGLAVLFRPAVTRSKVWRATATPLASVIGSGFLVVAPLLGLTVGAWASAAMAAILVLAFLVGGAVRYNIAHVEALTEAENGHGATGRALDWMGEAAKLVLAGAYVIAVAFYLELLGAFALRLLEIESASAQKAIASVLVVFIGLWGWRRGLKSLEDLEEYAVNAKLAVIAALLAGLALYNGEQLAGGSWRLPALEPQFDWQTVRILLGAFLIVQGFEISRYLRGVYARERRIRTMRYAQLITGGIYFAFIALATVLLDRIDTMSETGVIDLSAEVAALLPLLLVAGAVMSQFSSAVADTIGSGGLVEEASKGRMSHRVTYLGVAALALGLLWSTDIFAIIAHASRAFAAYYAIQCLMAATHAWSGLGGERRWLSGAGFAALTLAMVLVAVFAIPAESAGPAG